MRALGGYGGAATPMWLHFLPGNDGCWTAAATPVPTLLLSLGAAVVCADVEHAEVPGEIVDSTLLLLRAADFTRYT